MLRNRHTDDCPITRLWQQRAIAGSEPYSFNLLPSIELVNKQVWNALIPPDQATLTWEYLRAQEKGAPSTTTHRYLIMRDELTFLGVAYLHCTAFEGEPVDNLLKTPSPLITAIARGLGLVGRRLSMPVVVVGNPFTTGDPPWALAPECDTRRALQTVYAAVDLIVQEGTHAPRGIILKDFTWSTLHENMPRAQGLTRLETEPNMILTLDPEWHTFEHYLAAMRSKFRVKARRAYTKSEGLSARRLSLEELRARQDELWGLYGQVLARCDYHTGSLSPRSFTEMQEAIPEQFSIHAYFMGDSMVGFRSSFISGTTLHAQNVGIDYALNRAHGIYSRMLYDYVREAIAARISRINFGRTATEIKSCVGAQVVPMVCYIRHTNRFLNAGIGMVAAKVTPPQVVAHSPFRERRVIRVRELNASNNPQLVTA